MNLRKHPDVDQAPKDLLPYFWQLSSGVVCTSRTPASSSRSSNLNCVQRETDAATSQSWQQTSACYKQHWPVMITLECVRNLLEQDKEEDNPVSDAEWMCQQMRGDNYFAAVVEMHAGINGSPVDRTRAWWAGLLKLFGSHAAACSFLHRLLIAFQLHMRIPMEDIVYTEVEKMRKAHAEVGLPILQGSGMRMPMKGQKETFDWKSDHDYLFECFSLTWPPSMAELEKVVTVDGLFLREIQLAFFIDYAFPMAPGVSMDFVDINTDSKRLLAGCMDCMEVAEDEEEGKRCTVKIRKSPWKNPPGAIIGSTKVLVRYVRNGKKTIRAFNSLEYFMTIGWYAEDWARVDKLGFIGVQIHKLVEFHANLTGNAFTLYHVAPLELATLATYGRFTNPAMQDAVRDEIVHVASSGVAFFVHRA